MSETIRRVGFTGLGMMGYGMARHILEAGYELTVIANRSRENVDRLVAAGAQEAGTHRELAAASDVVLACLPSSDVVADVLDGPDGLLAGIAPGVVVVDASTGDPTRTAAFAAQVGAAGAVYVDAPVNRTPTEALAGTLHVLAGAPEDVLERVRPVLETFSETIHHLGDVGSGHRAKVIHNFVAQGNAAILAEAFTTAAKTGVDLAALAEVCRHSGGYSRTFERLIPYVLSGDDTGQRFAIRNAEKDMNYYTSLNRAAGTSSFVAESVRQTFQLATQIGYGEKYVAHLFDALGELGGTVVRHRPSADQQE